MLACPKCGPFPSTPRFSTGDTVVFVNDYGVNFGEKVITGVEWNDVRGWTYYFEPTDTPWFAHNERNLSLQSASHHDT